MRRESGQTLLLVLLSVAVVITIVLSILSRSVTDIAVTSREEEALRAFSAAEAGIERALTTGVFEPGDLEGSSFTGSVSNLAEGLKKFVYPEELRNVDMATFWFVSHADDESLVCNATRPCFTGSRIKVCWGKEGTISDNANTPAIEVSVLYTTTPGDYSTARLARDTADPNSSRRSANFFVAPDAGTCTVDSVTFAFQKTVDFASLAIPAATYNAQNGLQLGRIKILYNSDQSQPVALDADLPGNSPLPSQGRKIVSTGTSGESTRRVEVFQSFSDLPSIFDSAIFGPGLVK